MNDLHHFRAQFEGDLVTPDHPEYPQAIARWAVNSQRRAKIVAFVRSPTDVALAIRYARSNGLPLAVRGGGHNPAGASSCENGLVIDLSRYINVARVDADKKVVYVGGGALWEAVDKVAIQYGLATVAGTVNHTGVGGLLLGGGYGWLAPAHGLVIDNLLQATVVTADGSILTASATENPDLFFAIRGGGGNFGVAIEFVLKLHPQRRTVYAGMVTFAASALPKIVRATAEWFPNAGGNEGMFQIATVGPQGEPIIILCLFYNGTEVEGRVNFKRFFDIEPIADRSREMLYEEVNTLQNDIAYHGQGAYMKGASNRNASAAAIAKAHEKVVEIVQTSGFKAYLILEYLPLSNITSVPADATAFRREPTPNVLALTHWKENSPENTARARSVSGEILSLVTAAAPNQKLGYSNYDFDAVGDINWTTSDKAKLVFAKNYPRLQKIKGRYDPDNVFNRWFPIIPV